MAATFPLQIVSPASLVFEGAVALVEVPGVEGDFGVLPGHAPFFSMIRPGVVTIHDGAAKQKWFVTGGYADVSPEGTTILSDDVRPLAKLTLADALASIEQATELGLNAQTDAERARATKLRDAAEAMVQAVKAA